MMIGVAVKLSPFLAAFGLNQLYCPLYAVAFFITAVVAARMLEAVMRILSQTRRSVRIEKGDTRDNTLSSGDVTEAHRYQAIDGLRGFLAFGVVAHHVVINYIAMRSGVWQSPNSSLFNAFGNGCVAYFFMITAFLFWGKAQSNPERVSYRKLIPSRIKRLMPMYLVTYALMLFFVFVASGGQMRQSLPQMLAAICTGAMGGIVGIPYVNQIDPNIFNDHVLWSLQYEWCFYLSLPLLAKLFRGRSFVLIPVAVLCLCFCQPNNFSFACILQFVVGMLAAVLCGDNTRYPVFRSTWFAIVALAICAVTICNFNTLPYVLRPLGLAPLFLAIANGFNIFGLLTTHSAQFLGRISYSVYLLHGILLYAWTWLLSGFYPVENMSPETYWLACFALTVLTIPVCTLTFNLFEAPFIGRRENAGVAGEITNLSSLAPGRTCAKSL